MTGEGAPNTQINLAPRKTTYIDVLKSFGSILDEYLHRRDIKDIKEKLPFFLSFFNRNITHFVTNYQDFQEADRDEGANILLKNLFSLIDWPWESEDLGSGIKLNDLTEFVINKMAKVIISTNKNGSEYLDSYFLDFLYRLATPGESRYNNNHLMQINTQDFASRIDYTRKTISKTLTYLTRYDYQTKDPYRLARLKQTLAT